MNKPRMGRLNKFNAHDEIKTNCYVAFYVRSYVRIAQLYLNIFTLPLEYLQVNNSSLVTKMYYY